MNTRTSETILLKRDCSATLVPSGQQVTLLKDEEVEITQALGGTFTVIIRGNMARIEGKDADALGKDPVFIQAADPTAVAGPLDEKKLWDQLRTCYDPEIPVNLVDLGLIYDLIISPIESGGNRVHIKMTLTAPGCGMADSIANDVRVKASSVPGVTETNVELVWEPTWNQSMMSEAARLQLGLM